MNTFGRIYRLTSFGESHGRGIGGIIDGCPPGIQVDMDYIQNELSRRRPGQSKITTQRNEPDQVEFLSGIFEGKTQGTPIAFVVWNKDQNPGDYNDLKNVFRPSHADYTYQQKYGTRDHRGGGRSSARETIARVVAGAIARLILKKAGVDIKAFVSQVGEITLEKDYRDLDLLRIDDNIVRCPDQVTADRMIARIEEAGRNHDTVGGVITGVKEFRQVGANRFSINFTPTSVLECLESMRSKGLNMVQGLMGPGSVVHNTTIFLLKPISVSEQ